MNISFHQLCRLGLFAGLIVSVVVISPGDAIAQDIPAGYDDYFILPTSSVDFATLPMPADFFGPGSDPFEGIINIQGDTIVERTNGGTFPGGPYPVETTIDIELVALNLVSCEPIIVTSNGGQDPELWDLSIELPGPSLENPPEFPTAAGTLTATKTHANGGVFDSTFNVEPIFTFTRGGDQPATIEYYYYWDNIPPFDLNSVGDSWSNLTPDGFPANPSYFYPGGTPEDQTIAPETITLIGGPLQLDLVLAPEPGTLSLLAVGGLVLLRRRRK